MRTKNLIFLVFSNCFSFFLSFCSFPTRLTRGSSVDQSHHSYTKPTNQIFHSKMELSPLTLTLADGQYEAVRRDLSLGCVPDTDFVVELYYHMKQAVEEVDVWKAGYLNCIIEEVNSFRIRNLGRISPLDMESGVSWAKATPLNLN